MSVYPNLQHKKKNYKTNGIRYCGSDYRNDAGIVIDVQQDLPVVGCIKAL